MRKTSSPEETEEDVDVKKRRSRRKLEPGNPKAPIDDMSRELEEQLQQLQQKVVAVEQEQNCSEDDSSNAEQCNRVDAGANRTGDQTNSREEDTRKGAETADNGAARKQVESQRQRLEEALLLAKQRKRAEESTVDRDINRGTNGADSEDVKEIDIVTREKGIAPLSKDGDLIGHVLERLKSNSPENRASALNDLSRIASNQAFPIISKAFDDPSPEVRNAAAKALYSLESDPATTFGRALREATPERRRQIGFSLAASGLASDALGSLAGFGREKTHQALALLFLMAKAGEIRPLMTVIEEGQNMEVRLAVVNLLALNGRPEIIPPFRRLAVRGSLPAEVRSAVMEAIYQISSQQRETAGRK